MFSLSQNLFSFNFQLYPQLFMGTIFTPSKPTPLQLICLTFLRMNSESIGSFLRLTCNILRVFCHKTVCFPLKPWFLHCTGNAKFLLSPKTSLLQKSSLSMLFTYWDSGGEKGYCCSSTGNKYFCCLTQVENYLTFWAVKIDYRLVFRSRCYKEVILHKVHLVLS